MIKINPQKMIKIVKSFQNKRVLVLGDLMMDKYIWGYVSRISRLPFSSKRYKFLIPTISTSGVKAIRYLKVSANRFTACSIVSLEMSAAFGPTLILKYVLIPILGTTI